MSYLEEVADYSVDIRKGFTTDKWNRKDEEWVRNKLQIAHAAEQMKRRLSDADRQRLALDKKLARRIIWVLRPLAQHIGIKDKDIERGGKIGQEQKIAGAQVRWDDYCTETAAWLEQRAGLLAAYVVRGSGGSDHRPWANRRCFEYAKAAQTLRKIGSAW